jgi:hypothetical protein
MPGPKPLSLTAGPIVNSMVSWFVPADVTQSSLLGASPDQFSQPLMSSLPDPPAQVSVPGPPLILSLPVPPFRVSFPA